MSSLPTATLATRKRACELGAAFIESDLRELRATLQRNQEVAGLDNRPQCVTTSHEGDLLKAMEWASAITWLRAMAAEHDV